MGRARGPQGHLCTHRLQLNCMWYATPTQSRFPWFPADVWPCRRCGLRTGVTPCQCSAAAQPPPCRGGPRPLSPAPPRAGRPTRHRLPDVCATATLAAQTGSTKHFILCEYLLAQGRIEPLRG